MSSVLAIGAHYDDCAFGISGTLIKAARRGKRVVVLSLIGDLSHRRSAQGREREIIDELIRLAKDRGVEMRFLPFGGVSRIDDRDANADGKRALAEAVAEIDADVAFVLWPHDRHPDHEAASALSTAALRHAGRLTERQKTYRVPERIYYYDNGPRHTIGFEPDTYVDVTQEWPEAIEWLGKVMALARDATAGGEGLDRAQRAKEALARYRGLACGVEYAEAFRADSARPIDIF